MKKFLFAVSIGALAASTLSSSAVFADDVSATETCQARCMQAFKGDTSTCWAGFEVCKASPDSSTLLICIDQLQTCSEIAQKQLNECKAKCTL